jgi:hypothetical protein
MWTQNTNRREILSNRNDSVCMWSREIKIKRVLYRVNYREFSVNGQNMRQNLVLQLPYLAIAGGIVLTFTHYLAIHQYTR